MTVKQFVQQELMPGERLLWQRRVRWSLYDWYGLLGEATWPLFCFVAAVAFLMKISDVLAPLLTPFAFTILVCILIWKVLCSVCGCMRCWRRDVLTNYRIIRVDWYKRQLYVQSIPLSVLLPEVEQGRLVFHLPSPYTWNRKNTVILGRRKDCEHLLGLIRQSTHAEAPSLPEPITATHPWPDADEQLYCESVYLSHHRYEELAYVWGLLWGVWSGGSLFIGLLSLPAEATWLTWCICCGVLALSGYVLVSEWRMRRAYREEWSRCAVGSQYLHREGAVALPIQQCYPHIKVQHADGTASFCFKEPDDYRDGPTLSHVKHATRIQYLLHTLASAAYNSDEKDRKETAAG